jgi:DNA polymerase-3 subunit delta
MIIFLYGEDSYRLIKERESIVQKYKAKHGSGFNFFKIDGANTMALSQVTEAVKSVSLFDEVKLILVSNIFSNQETAEGIQELLLKYKIPDDSKIVLLATHVGTNSAAKPKELFTILTDKKHLVRDFSSLEGSRLEAWVKKEAMERGVSLPGSAMHKFIATAGADSWSRINNLEKLANYARGPITPVMVDLLIKTETEPNVFEFIDALGSGRKAQAFALLSTELAFGRDPYYLLTMVMYQARNMLMVKDCVDRNMSSNQIAQKTNLHPFVIKKMMSATNRISLTQIKQLYEEVLDLEQGTKQGRRDLEDGLFSLALKQ